VVHKISAALNMPPNQIFGFLAEHLPDGIDALSPQGTLKAPPKNGRIQRRLRIPKAQLRDAKVSK
jgi:uncharacterized protein YidB (DUF937 family)